MRDFSLKGKRNIKWRQKRYAHTRTHTYTHAKESDEENEPDIFHHRCEFTMISFRAHHPSSSLSSSSTGRNKIRAVTGVEKIRKGLLLCLLLLLCFARSPPPFARAFEKDDGNGSAETDVAKFLGYTSPEKLFGKQSFFAKLQHKLEAPKLRGMASFVPRQKLEGEEEPRESFGFKREAYIGGHFISGASPDLDVGVVVRVPRAAFAEKGELEKLTTSAEWFVFGDKNPGERVEHESETSVVFAKLRTPERGEFELPLRFRARYAKPVFRNKTEEKAAERGGAKSAEEMKRSENDVNSSSNSNTISSSSSEANTEERGKREGGEENEEPKWSKTHSRIVFPNVVILARREDDTGPWTRVGELEMRGSWYVPIAYSNQAIGVKMMSIIITVGAGALVFKAIRQKIVEEHYGLNRSSSIPSLKKSRSKKNRN